MRDGSAYSNSTLHLDGPLDHAVHHRLGLYSLGLVVEQDSVEVAIANVSNNGAEQSTLGHVLLGLLDQLGQLAHGHGNVASPDAVTGLLDSHGAPQSLLARTPELVLLLLAARKLKGLASSAGGQSLHLRNLLLDTGSSACELEEESRGLGPCTAGHAGLVDALHLVVVEDLDGGNGDTGGDDLADTGGGMSDGGEGGDGDAGGSGLDGDLKGGFGDETEGSLRADEELGEIVTGGALARTLSGLDDGTIGEDDSQAEDPFAHSTVSVGIGTTASSSNHTSNHGTRAWVRREEKSLLAQVVIQGLPAHGGLDDNIQVLLVQLDDLVHSAEIDRHTISGGGEVALETGTAAVSNDGDLPLVAHLHDLRDLLGGAGVDDAE